MPDLSELAARERQVAETVYKLNEAAVSEVLQEITDPPSYSAVRAILSILVQKGFLKYREERNRYLYSPAVPKINAGKSVLRNLLDTFYHGKATDAVAALLDVASDELGTDDYDALKKMIEKARKGS